MTEITKEQIANVFDFLCYSSERIDHDTPEHFQNIDKQLIDEIHAIARRGLETQRKPIEQAPKDGSLVLLFLKYDKEIAAAVWKEKDGGGWWQTLGGGELYDPTHFIPLSTIGEPK